MPIRVLVIETETGETLVSYNRLSVLMRSSSNSELKGLGESIDEKLARIVRLAASE